MATKPTPKKGRPQTKGTASTAQPSDVLMGRIGEMLVNRADMGLSRSDVFIAVIVALDGTKRGLSDEVITAAINQQLTPKTKAPKKIGRKSPRKVKQ